MKRTVIITGATSGIGRSAAFRYAEKGYQLILCGRRAQRLQEVEEELQRTFQAAVQTLCFDIRDPEACAQAVSSIDRNRFPEMNILVNNAGLAAGFGPVDQGNYDDWNRMIDTNVKGLLHMSREIIPFMREQKSGHIINIGSTAGKDVYLNGNVYCATKFAVDALTKSMRIDLLPYGIKVTSINPGACETEFSLVRFNGDEARAKSVYEGFTPLTPDDVADAILYVSELPAHVCVNDLTLTCLTQANSNYNIKKP
ncbi:MAG TPA: SDR family NAD(P)-dependent oxidoreductase [Chitinophagaceae bacterium]|nr:SDR family NAD(P)-dependent oxidoreductase [Chitinophagaceae bacterium]HNF70988.1 SDR family NAD(P)-dependent oxidoreductase [Chitinophagaceae bacterium]